MEFKKRNTVNRKELTQSQVTDLLYYYMVEGQSGAAVCSNVLHMTKDEIGDTRSAWRIFDHIYRGFGFPKRYKGAYKNITRQKLAQYVSKYWEVYAKEADLLAFFPEIASDYARAKKESGDKDSGTSKTRVSSGNSGSTKSGYDPYSYKPKNNTEGTHATYSQSYSDRNAKTYSGVTHAARGQSYSDSNSKTYSGVTHATRSQTYSDRNAQTYSERTRTDHNRLYSDMNEQEYSDRPVYSGGSSEGLETILAVVVLVVIGYFFLRKIGIIKSAGSFIKNLLLLAERILFYGGIVLFVLALFRRRARELCGTCILISLIGLMFGALSEGHIVGAVGCALIGAGCKFFLDSRIDDY